MVQLNDPRYNYKKLDLSTYERHNGSTLIDWICNCNSHAYIISILIKYFKNNKLQWINYNGFAPNDSLTFPVKQN